VSAGVFCGASAAGLLSGAISAGAGAASGATTTAEATSGTGAASVTVFLLPAKKINATTITTNTPNPPPANPTSLLPQEGHFSEMLLPRGYHV